MTLLIYIHVIVLFVVRKLIYNKMVSIRRKRGFKESYTVIVFDKDNIHEWPTTEQEHGKILEIFKQDKPYEGIINDYTIYKKLFE